MITSPSLNAYAKSYCGWMISLPAVSIYPILLPTQTAASPSLNGKVQSYCGWMISLPVVSIYPNLPSFLIANGYRAGVASAVAAGGGSGLGGSLPEDKTFLFFLVE